MKTKGHILPGSSEAVVVVKMKNSGWNYRVVLQHF